MTLQVPNVTKTTVADLKVLMKKKHDHLVPEDIRLWFAGKDLRETNADGETLFLADYNIQDKSTLTMVIRVMGGVQTSLQLQAF